VRPPKNLSWAAGRLRPAQGGQFGLLFTGMKLGMPAGISVVLQTQAFITMLLAAAFWAKSRSAGNGWACSSPCRTAADRCSPWRGAIQMTLIGFVLTVGAAAMWAGSNLLTRMAAKQGSYEPVSFIVWTSVFPMLPLLLLSLWVDGADSVASQLQAMAGERELGVIAYLAFLSTCWAMACGRGCCSAMPPAPWRLCRCWCR
jgi:O-acetylserine/cysteine efflux transporter